MCSLFPLEAVADVGSVIELPLAESVFQWPRLQHPAAFDPKCARVRGTITWTIAGQSLASLPLRNFFCSERARTSDRNDTPGRPLPHQVLRDRASGLLFRQNVSITEFSDDRSEPELRVLHLAADAVYKGIEFEKSLDIALDQEACADQGIHRR